MTSDRKAQETKAPAQDQAEKHPDAKARELDAEQLDEVTGGMRKAGGDPLPFNP